MQLQQFSAARASARISHQRRSVIVCSEKPRVVSGREFREDDGSMTSGAQSSNAQPGQQQPLYADPSMPPRAQKKGNLSKEMKQRLRQEYYGLGGAENKAMSNNYFLWIILAISALAVASSLTGAL